MAYCTNCGNKLSEGAKFCTNCGNPVTASAAQSIGNDTGKTEAPAKRLKIRNCKAGWTDYRKLNNVCLISNPSQHVVYHFVTHVLQLIVLIYVLILFLPAALPALIGIEGSSEIEYVPGMFPGLSAMILITIISGIIQYKIRLDIFHKLPKGFDYWQIKRLFIWNIFGFESLKTAVLRFFRKEDHNYPELGFGTDNEGNYYAFAVQGKDVDQYPFCPSSVMQFYGAEDKR